MDLATLLALPPFDWPDNSHEVILSAMRDPDRDATERIAAAGLAAECMTGLNGIVRCLLDIVEQDSEAEALRCAAALSIGPFLEEASGEELMGDELPYLRPLESLPPALREALVGESGDDEVLLPELFEQACKSLRRLQLSAEVPVAVRRAVLIAAVHVPDDWQFSVVRGALSGDDEWRRTGVTCLQYLRGMDEEILEALASEDPLVVEQALLAARIWELDAAWETARRICKAPGNTPDAVLIAAIRAVAAIRPGKASDVLTPLMKSEDETIADEARLAYQEALDQAEVLALLDGEPPESLFGRDLRLESEEEDSPALRARSVMVEAYDTNDPLDRLALAEEALGIHEDCADAWVMIAEEGCRTLQEKLAAWTKAMEAGERELGPEAFDEMAGQFWGFLATRPYMSARFGLASTLLELKRVDEALEHFRELIALNPNDNQGVRWILLDTLLETGQDDEARALLESYEDDAYVGAAFGATLLAFRASGDCEESRSLRTAAMEANPHVVNYLTGKRRLPKSAPDFMGFGDKNEAVCCAMTQRAAWRSTEGALFWLENPDGKKRRRR